MKILVACTGNSCRSQMAEGFIKTLVPSAEIFSAGVKPEKNISSYALKVMSEKDIDISGQYPKSIRKFETESFDYIITFSESAENATLNIKAKNKLFLKVEDPFDTTGTNSEILEKYRKVRDDIEGVCKKLTF